MVLAPKTLLGQWVKELTLCGLGSRVYEYYGTSSADRSALPRTYPSLGCLERGNWSLVQIPNTFFDMNDFFKSGYIDAVTLGIDSRVQYHQWRKRYLLLKVYATGVAQPVRA